MDNTSKGLIGAGPMFKYSIGSSGGLASTEGLERINQSLFMIFETPKGSRLILPEFGSDIYKYKFDPLDAVLLEKIRYTITEDVKRWEPRISLTSIEFLLDNEAIDRSTLYISLSYTVINTSVSGNYVYPFKLTSYDTITI